VVMVDQEPIDAALAELAQRRSPLDDKAKILRAEVAQGQAEIDGELTTARAARSAEAAELPPALSERYEALRTRLKGTGAARLIGRRRPTPSSRATSAGASSSRPELIRARAC